MSTRATVSAQAEPRYVVSTSIFPSIGAVNPALAALANALRVGDHLLDQFGVRTETQIRT
jgi:choline dehydrogenase-like flavoprotein